LGCGEAQQWGKNVANAITTSAVISDSRENCHGIQLSRRPPPTYTFVTHEALSMSQPTPLAVEEHVHGETVWVALRARGAEWSWLTPDEALRLGREWVEKYSGVPRAAE
jgi:hypothetical protein